MGKTDSTAPPRWKVGQEVVAVGGVYRVPNRARISKIGRKYVYARRLLGDGIRESSWEEKYDAETGVAPDNGGKIMSIGQFERSEREDRLRRAVREAGWAPDRGERPIEEWRAVATALGLEVE